VYSNLLAPEHLTIKVLSEFHKNLISKNLDNDVIKVNHSDLLKFELPESSDFEIANCREISQLKISSLTNKVSLIFRDSRSENLEIELKRAIELLAKYDVIYFTQSLEIAQFVDRKGIFKVMRSERVIDEIRELEEYRRKEKEKVINYFEVEKNRLLEEKNRKISEYQNQIEDNERIQKENEIIIRKSKDEINLIKQVYDDFIKRISEISDQLKSGGSFDKLKNLYNENKNEFIRSVQELKPFNPIKKLSNYKIKTDLEFERTSERHQGANKKGKPNKYPSSECNCKDEIAILKHNLIFFKWAFIVVLIVFLFCGVMTFLLTKESGTKKLGTEQIFEPANIEDAKSELPLSPAPNGYLEASEVDKLRLIAGASLSDVVDKIFELNPNDIQSKYNEQKAQYRRLLHDKNKRSFQVSSDNEHKILYNGTKLEFVPCLKNKKDE
jgi:hypothetical protein